MCTHTHSLSLSHTHTHTHTHTQTHLHLLHCEIKQMCPLYALQSSIWVLTVWTPFVPYWHHEIKAIAWLTWEIWDWYQNQFQRGKIHTLPIRWLIVNIWPEMKITLFYVNCLLILFWCKDLCTSRNEAQWMTWIWKQLCLPNSAIWIFLSLKSMNNSDKLLWSQYWPK